MAFEDECFERSMFETLIEIIKKLYGRIKDVLLRGSAEEKTFLVATVEFSGLSAGVGGISLTASIEKKE